MNEFHQYQIQLEKEHGKNLKDIITEYYITKNLGPSTAAKELNIPRQAFIYFRNFYGLRETKHALQEQSKTF